jgi:hypothetical protein
VPPSSTLLNSEDCFIFLVPFRDNMGVAYTWIGAHASQEDALAAQAVAREQLRGVRCVLVRVCLCVFLFLSFSLTNTHTHTLTHTRTHTHTLSLSLSLSLSLLRLPIPGVLGADHRAGPRAEEFLLGPP